MLALNMRREIVQRLVRCILPTSPIFKPNQQHGKINQYHVSNFPTSDIVVVKDMVILAHLVV